jgi:hypothetical protein
LIDVAAEGGSVVPFGEDFVFHVGSFLGGEWDLRFNILSQHIIQLDFLIFNHWMAELLNVLSIDGFDDGVS